MQHAIIMGIAEPAVILKTKMAVKAGTGV